LVVEDAFAALLSLAGEARRDFQGKVLGVTGSSGKTTVVAMLDHVLRTRGLTEKSLASANMLYGVAWNLAAMSREAGWWIVEMALAGMDDSSPLARPDVAVVLNVSEAHLKYWKTVENIARQKSKIFNGMKQGSLAAINRDMEQFPIFAEAAEKKEVGLLTFGRHQDADLRLLGHDSQAMRFTWKGEEFRAGLPAPGLHVAMNSLAVLGGLAALGLPHLDFLNELADFQPLAGRGERHSLNIDGKKVVLVDESYNANPASMRAALATFVQLAPDPATRLLVMGDMLELDKVSAIMHAELEEPTRAAQPDRVLLCGPEMRALRERLEGVCQGQWYPDMKSLKDDLLTWIKDGDHILLKGSHGTELWKLVKLLCSHVV
jgi:UDP-N-acetylmuramoyl-tripeptide--D-alanyl-D-alanine ligase